MRRSLSFLLLSAVFVALVGACGGDSGPDAFPTSTDASKSIPEGQRAKINVVIAGSDWYVGTNNFVFGVTDKNDDPQGGAKTKVTFYDLRDQKNPKPVETVDGVASSPGVGPKTTVTHANGESHTHGGEDEGRVGYYVTTKFTYAGLWGAAVEATLKDGTKGTSSVAFEVKEKPGIVAAGMAAPKSDNLTKKDVTNIKEIDSGTPPNDMHDVKIKDAIAAGRPLVVLFATPAYCTSRFCGPVTEEVEALQAKYRDKVDFVHIEIWRNFEKKELNPTVKEWIQRADGGLSEPIVYVVDAQGTVYDRWEGPVAANVMDAAVAAVAGGKLYKAP